MTIEVKHLVLGILFLLGSALMVFLMVVLFKLGRVLTNVNNLLERNSNNLDKTLESLPKIAEGVEEITDNVKVVSEVVTATTASVITTKDTLGNYIGIAKDIVEIVIKTFRKTPEEEVSE